MFNRQPFNRGRFNRGLVNSVFFEGKASARFEAVGQFNRRRPIEGGVDINLHSTFEDKIYLVRGLEGSADIELAAYGEKSIPRTFEGNAALSMSAANSQLVRGRVFDLLFADMGSKFNRMKFNRGKFNASGHLINRAGMSLGLAGRLNIVTAIRGCAKIALSSTGHLNAALGFTGGADMGLSADTTLNLAHALQVSAGLNLAATGQITAAIPFLGSVAIDFSATVDRLSRAFGLRGAVIIILAVNNEGFNIFRYEHIHLPTLNIAVGGELIIDTDNMTITLNGQNVMQHLSRDSEFFLINPATNEIVYTSANQNNWADIRILHKDAWL